MRVLCSFPITKQAIWTYLACQHIGGVVKHALVHTWHACKLFWLNTKLAWRTARRIMRGEKVSAIEKNRMRRALADIFLMFPFSTFILIPGAEILIPLYVKMFPNAVPRKVVECYIQGQYGKYSFLFDCEYPMKTARKQLQFLGGTFLKSAFSISLITRKNKSVQC